MTRQTVSGTPTSELYDPTGATVGPAVASTVPRRSLVLVLPDDPVMPTTAMPGSRRTTSRARAAKASWVSATTTHGTPSTGRVTRAATEPRSTAAGTKS